MAKVSTGLNDKHLKALALIEEGKKTREEISSAVGLSHDYLHGLISGDPKFAPVSALFKAEFLKIQEKQTKELKRLTKENKALAMSKINQRLRYLSTFKSSREVTLEVCTIMNAMAKMTPSIEIDGGLHTHYHLTPEERIHEFNRLVRAAYQNIRGTVSVAARGRAVKAPGDTGTGSRLPQVPAAE